MAFTKFGDIKIKVDFDELEAAFGWLKRNKRFKLRMNKIIAEEMEPYVPYREGGLAHSVEITPDGIWYRQPYARYQYNGVVYGPNYLLQDGTWASPEEKHPTGHIIGDREGQVITKTWKTGEIATYVYGYTRTMHPLATHHWDVQMMEDRRDELTAKLKPLILENIRKRGRSARRAGRARG